MCMIVTVYFYYVSRSWKPLIELVGIALFVAAILVRFLSESPRFLYDQQRYEELHKNLEYMAITNGK